VPESDIASRQTESFIRRRMGVRSPPASIRRSVASGETGAALVRPVTWTSDAVNSVARCVRCSREAALCVALSVAKALDEVRQFPYV